jgi:hypothetical protein
VCTRHDRSWLSLSSPGAFYPLVIPHKMVYILETCHYIARLHTACSTNVANHELKNWPCASEVGMSLGVVQRAALCTWGYDEISHGTCWYMPWALNVELSKSAYDACSACVPLFLTPSSFALPVFSSSKCTCRFLSRTTVYFRDESKTRSLRNSLRAPCSTSPTCERFSPKPREFWGTIYKIYALKSKKNRRKLP